VEKAFFELAKEGKRERSDTKERVARLKDDEYSEVALQVTPRTRSQGWNIKISLLGNLLCLLQVAVILFFLRSS